MSSKDERSFTRGNGLLEPYLAKLRTQMANRLISESDRNGRVLDIGCGSYSYFLSHTSFTEKFAIDQLSPTGQPVDIIWHILDLNSSPKLPFKNNYFNIITMLAVVEHLDPSALIYIFQEINRVLQPGGKVIITTPAAWSDGLLRLMARIGLVSREEIDEHVYAYTLPLLGWYFGKAGFEMSKIKFGYFEMMLNLWATAEKS